MALLPFVLALFGPLLLSVVAVFSTSVLLVNWGTWQIIQKYATPEERAELGLTLHSES